MHFILVNLELFPHSHFSCGGNLQIQGEPEKQSGKAVIALTLIIFP